MGVIVMGRGADLGEAPEGARRLTLVWIDAREAAVVRWDAGRASLERSESEVPAHHRATRHGPPGELHRLEHLERFVVDVAERVPPEHDLVILGPGTVRERLEREVLDGDARHGRTRTVTCGASLPMTDRQLVARLRHLVGSDPRRRTVGAYRWSEAPAHQPSGRLVGLPRRKVQKPPGQPDAAKP